MPTRLELSADRDQMGLFSESCSWLKTMPRARWPGHLRIVQDVELLALGEGKVILCPGLIVIQGDEQGHPSPCRVKVAQQSRAQNRAQKGGTPSQALSLPTAAAPWCPKTFGVQWISDLGLTD